MFFDGSQFFSQNFMIVETVILFYIIQFMKRDINYLQTFSDNSYDKISANLFIEFHITVQCINNQAVGHLYLITFKTNQ
jgi:hypothetical protein